jgi:hypothetical protein
MGKDLGDIFITHQLVADRRSVLGRHQHIEIAHRVAPSAKAAGDDDAPAVAQKADQGLGFGLRDRQLEAFFNPGLFECLRELFGDGEAKALDVPQTPGVEDASEVVESAYLELVVEELDSAGLGFMISPAT